MYFNRPSKKFAEQTDDLLSMFPFVKQESELPVHPVATIIKNKYQEYYNYRLPDGCPTWEPDDDDNGIIKRFSSPRIIYTASFLHRKGYVSFSEWLLYFLPNQKDLWYEYYY